MIQSMRYMFLVSISNIPKRGKIPPNLAPSSHLLRPRKRHINSFSKLGQKSISLKCVRMEEYNLLDLQPAQVDGRPRLMFKYVVVRDKNARCVHSKTGLHICSITINVVIFRHFEANKISGDYQFV